MMSTTPDPTTPDPGKHQGSRRPDPLATFRSRRGRVVALGVMWVVLAVFGFIALFLPPDTGWKVGDRIMLFGLGVLIAVIAWRYASIRAVPTTQGLLVRNLVVSRTLEWAQIVGVQFGGGAPWVTLDVDDGDTLAVMAIQKADGEFGRREASRLAALVEAFGTAAPPEADR